MKQGSTIQDLAAKLLQQAPAKRDFLTDTRLLRLESSEGGSSRLHFGEERFSVSDHAHRQIADRLGIPARYYELMRQRQPELLDANVNAWFAAKPENRLIRTLGGAARAFLSDRYRRIDNVDIAEAVLPIIGDLPGAQVVSCELTETRLYLKVVNQRLQLDVRPGDAVQAGFLLSNSEIGAGSVRVEPLLYRLVCSNGLIAADYSQRRHHVGRLLETEDNREIFRDETLEADDKAFFLKVQDTVRLAVDAAKFSHLVRRLQETTEQPLTGNPVRAVELLASRHGLTQEESGGVLRNLIAGGDLSQYGLLNAVTRTSQDVRDYDRATELERLGGQIMTLPPQDWGELAKAA